MNASEPSVKDPHTVKAMPLATSLFGEIAKQRNIHQDPIYADTLANDALRYVKDGLAAGDYTRDDLFDCAAAVGGCERLSEQVRSHLSGILRRLAAGTTTPAVVVAIVTAALRARETYEIKLVCALESIAEEVHFLAPDALTSGA